MLTRRQNLKRLETAIPALHERLPRLNADAAAGASALIMLISTAWIPGRVPKRDLQQLTDFIVGTADVPDDLLNETLPGFVELWDTPVVQSVMDFVAENYPQ